MSANVLIDGDRSHRSWIETALSYLPEDIIEKEDSKLAVIGLGGIGGCRLPQDFRQREVLLLSDWVFPPVGQSEGDAAGQFFMRFCMVNYFFCRYGSVQY